LLIRHLSYFIALAREQHFARAAAACNVTQPTLTAAIKKLEEDLDVRLAVRDRRFVRLTEEGEKLLVWGRQILVDYGSLRDDLAGLRRGLVGTLHLGVIPAAMSAVSFLTSRFAAAHPAAHVEIRSMTSRAIERALEAFEIDAGVTYLENELSEDMQNRRIINKVASSIGVEIKADVVSNSYVAILSHVRRGEWASIVPHTYARLLSAADLIAIDIIEPIHTQAVGLVLSDREPLSPMSGALLSSIANVDFERDLDAADEL
jgi:DNA-binding transcriptional LysR family regulator